MTLGLPLVFQPYKVRVLYVSEIEGDDKATVLTDPIPYALCTLRSVPKQLIEIRNRTRTKDKDKGLCFMIVPSAHELQGRYDTEPRFEKTIEVDNLYGLERESSPAHEPDLNQEEVVGTFPSTALEVLIN